MIIYKVYKIYKSGINVGKVFRTKPLFFTIDSAFEYIDSLCLKNNYSRVIYDVYEEEYILPRVDKFKKGGVNVNNLLCSRENISEDRRGQNIQILPEEGKRRSILQTIKSIF